MMGKEVQRHRLLITLDALMDTRLAALAEISSEGTEAILLNGTYHGRRHNHFHLLDDRFAPGQFERLYAERGKQQLVRKAYVTPMVQLIRDLVARYQEGELVTPDHCVVEVTINTCPYTLTEEEKAGLRDMLIVQTHCASVNYVYLSLPYLTPETLSHYSTIIGDDFDAWITEHHPRINDTILSGRELYFPERLLKPEMANKALPQAVIGNLGRMTFARQFILELMPLEFFSVLRQPL